MRNMEHLDAIVTEYTEHPDTIAAEQGRAVPHSRSRGRLWAVVLAGGEGVRLRPLTRQVCGDERPKQYVPVFGSRTLLRQTLERVALAVAPERTVIVSQERHAEYMAAELRGAASASTPHVLVQPENRGTAAGILFPAHWIHWRDPEATVAIFPSDHFIPEGGQFMAHVRRVAALGARPTSAETEYGWIEPGAAIGQIGADPILKVRRFWEKPTPALARVALGVGCLWNTFVFVARAATLLEEGRRALPEMCDRLSRIVPFAGTEHERWAVRHAYALSPTANFSRAVLAAAPASLAVSRLPALTWSDWGTPSRVLQSLERAGISPPWLGDPAPTPAALASRL